MILPVRPKIYSLPSYSLTSDLLGFLRCGLQYRYSRLGRLPSSRPVQLWFGEFIHGVLEEAYRRYKDSASKGKAKLPPWSKGELDDIKNLIKKRLAARGLVPWDDALELIGDNRAEAAIQELGPYLFPLISRAEVRLYGARMLPSIPKAYQFRVADRYEMVGVVDVVTHVTLADPEMKKNPLVQLMLSGLSSMPKDKFEVIVDYKGMRRPAIKGSPLWTQYEWQLQTYGELRRRQHDALPVAAGVLVYVNELYPTRSDLELLKKEIKDGTTDVPPLKGSKAETLLNAWKMKDPSVPILPFEYRLARAIRVISVNDTSIATALSEFDKVVERIEICRGKEVSGITVLRAWEKNTSHEDTCVVCDSRTYCPDYQKVYAKKHIAMVPRLPMIKIK